jgi:hypothetical protein
MAERIPQSVARRFFLKAYLSSDHVTPATSKTIAITISKNGGAYANPSAGTVNATEIGNGSYYFDASTTDLGTAGPFAYLGTCSGVDNVERDFQVVSAHNAGFDGVPDATAGGNNGLATVDANNNIHGLQPGTGTGQLNVAGGIAPSNLSQVLGTALSEGSPGWLAAAFKKFFNVSTPTATADTMATIASQTSILNAVNAITNVTARSAPRVPEFMPRPASGSVTYTADLYLFNLQGALEDADANTVTVHARNAAGTSLDAGLASTTMTRLGAGWYRLTYTVASTDTAQAVYFDFSWSVSSTAMRDGGATEVQDAENYAYLLAIKNQTDQLRFDVDSNIKSNPQTKVDLVDSPNATAVAAIASAVWANGTRTLSSFGTLVADAAAAVWATVSRTITGTVQVGSYAAGQSPATLVLDAASSSHTAGGTVGADIAAAAAGGGGGGGGSDQWLTDVSDPDTYPGNTAGGMLRNGKSKWDLISAPSVQVAASSPSFGKRYVIRGRSYLTANGNAFAVTTGAQILADLDGYTVTLSARPERVDLAGQLSVAGTVDTATGANQQVHFDITGDDSDVTEGDWLFRVSAASDADATDIVDLGGGKLVIGRNLAAAAA